MKGLVAQQCITFRRTNYILDVGKYRLTGIGLYKDDSHSSGGGFFSHICLFTKLIDGRVLDSYTIRLSFA